MKMNDDITFHNNESISYCPLCNVEHFGFPCSPFFFYSIKQSFLVSVTQTGVNSSLVGDCFQP